MCLRKDTVAGGRRAPGAGSEVSRLLCAKLADTVPAGAARSRGPAAGMSTGHGPLRATHDRSPTAAVGLRWTCDPHSSASSQQ
ncbi:unnamed protein product [Sphagnum jensenii]